MQLSWAIKMLLGNARAVVCKPWFLVLSYHWQELCQGTENEMEDEAF